MLTNQVRTFAERFLITEAPEDFSHAWQGSSHALAQRPGALRVVFPSLGILSSLAFCNWAAAPSLASAPNSSEITLRKPARGQKDPYNALESLIKPLRAL